MMHSMAATWLIGTWFLILNGKKSTSIRPKLFVEGVPYQSFHARAGGRQQQQQQQQQQQRQHNQHNPQKPKSRTDSGFSPALDIGGDYDSEVPTSSYFERHGLTPPPIISRRRMQTTASEEPAQEASNSNANDDDMTELEKIILNAKRGEDANARLRHDLLWGHENFERYFYDKHSYPWEYAWYNQSVGNRTGVPIETNINFHRVFSVDIVNSVMDLVVWFRMVWVDPRLTWDPAEYGGLNKTWFWLGDGGAGGETSEIWTPDIELWNLETGLKGSLEDTYARVSYDGIVWWGRPGHLRPACKFYGLDDFPFDKLTCQMEFGAWKHSGKFLRVKQYNNVGYTLGGSLTAGESYTEFSFVEDDPIVSREHIYSAPEFDNMLEEDWPVLLYNVTVTRSWQPYARGYIVVQIFLNFVGFCAFWLPPSCGERMGLSITAMLAALASEIVIAAKLPAAKEMTWFSKFSIMSLSFAFISLLESVLVLYFYYKRSEDIVPGWYTYTKNWYLVRQAKKGGEEVKRQTHQIVGKTRDIVNENAHNAAEALHSATGTTERFTREETNGDAEDECIDEDDVKEPLNDSHDVKEPLNISVLSFGTNARGGKVKIKSVPRTESGNTRCRTSMMREFHDRFGDSVQIPRNVDDFYDGQELENNLRWKLVASRIDDVARFWIPLAFVITLSIILADH